MAGLSRSAPGKVESSAGKAATTQIAAVAPAWRSRVSAQPPPLGARRPRVPRLSVPPATIAAQPQWRRRYGIVTTPLVGSIEGRIAEELGVRERQVKAAVELLDGGSTVPFIARYRKEATEMLDDAQLRTLEERLRYLRELEERRDGDPRVGARAGQAGRRRWRRRSAAPRPRRAWRTSTCRSSRSGAPRRRSPARRGWSRWPRACSATRRVDPLAAAAAFVDADKGVADAAGRAGRRPRDPHRAVLGGRRPDRRAARAHVGARPAGRRRCGTARRRRAPSSPTTSTSPSRSPSCPRTAILAMLRGEKEEVLDLVLEPEEPPTSRPLARTRASSPTASGSPTAGRPGDKWLPDTVRWAWRTRILVHLGIDLRLRLRTAAEDEAVRVFAANLRDLLLAAPAGTRATLGLDPGFRTGVKVAVVDATGKVVATDVDLPARAGEQVGRVARQAGPARQGARGRPDRDRQRHGVPRDRQARR